MKKFVVLTFTIISCPLFSMQNSLRSGVRGGVVGISKLMRLMSTSSNDGAFEDIGHPCLPDEFYEKAFAPLVDEVLMYKSQGVLLNNFTDYRLSYIRQILTMDTIFDALDIDNNVCKKKAYRWAEGLLQIGNDDGAFFMMKYGNLVAELLALAVRKNMGVRSSRKHPYETWELRKVSNQEYSRLLEGYGTGIFPAMLLEEEHAHHKIRELTGTDDDLVITKFQ